MKTMQQYWVTKKSVSRKLGGKEDECIVSSDAELDAKLELFRSISDSCIQLQKVIDLYQERLCCLAQEENTLGRYLKECGKNEKNTNAGQIMSISGKALAYTGHQRLCIRPHLVRLHHEVETFRARAVTDTKNTIVEMEKVRTEYRAALAWMKSASAQLDPDTGHGLEKFRKAQSYVRTTKIKFDRLMLACLQKIDLLAAARCNMFSHALVGYQNSITLFSKKASDTLSSANCKLKNVEPFDFTIVTELASGEEDKDKKTFFNSEYSDDKTVKETNLVEDKSSTDESNMDTNLLGEDFLNIDLENKQDDQTSPHSDLFGLEWPTTNLPKNNFLNNEFMPSQLLRQDYQSALLSLEEPVEKPISKVSKESTSVSWLSLFAELDPLAQETNKGEDQA